MLFGAAASSGSLLQSSDRVQTGYKTASHSLMCTASLMAMDKLTAREFASICELFKRRTLRSDGLIQCALFRLRTSARLRARPIFLWRK